MSATTYGWSIRDVRGAVISTGSHLAVRHRRRCRIH